MCDVRGLIRMAEVLRLVHILILTLLILQLEYFHTISETNYLEAVVFHLTDFEIYRNQLSGIFPPVPQNFKSFIYNFQTV
jgi:hypothetical protein